MLTPITTVTVMTFSGGLIVPGSMALATAPFKEISGTSASLYGALQMAIGAFWSFLATIVGHGSAVVGFILVLEMLLGLVVLVWVRVWGRRRLPDDRRHTNLG